MIKRLRIKFVCINMTIVTVMLAVIFGLILNFTKSNLEKESIQMMQSIANNSFRPGRPDKPVGDVRLPYFTLQIGRGGELIATGGGYYDLSNKEFLMELLDISFSSTEQTGIISEYGLRYCHVITPEQQLVVFADMSSETNTMRSLLKTCIFIGALSFVLFFFLSLFLSHWAVKPIDIAWKQQRQFVADASHELKTPLTVIITNAQLLQSAGQDETAQAQFTDNILTMSHRMKGLVEGLLELARVDNGTARMVFSTLDFSQLVADALLPFEPLYFEKGLELQCTIEPDIHLKGCAVQLRQVIDILLDNAAKYSSPQATVNVTLARQRTHCVLSVCNPGETISKEDLKNIFERFYRVDKSRSMNRGYGLGLPIADSIVKAHHGKIWAESTDGVNTFLIQLPTVLP